MKTKKLFFLFNKKDSIILTLISIFLAINVVLLANRKSEHSFFAENQNPAVFYFIFVILAAVAITTIFPLFVKKDFGAIFKKTMLMLLPLEAALVLSLYFLKPKLNVLFFLFAAIFIFISIFFLLKNFHKKNSIEPCKKNKPSQWLASQGRVIFSLLFLIMFVAAIFGNYKIAQFSAVDEALWTFDRIPSFWKNISEKDWNGTSISDKPGITVAIVSGVGMLQIEPKQYDPEKNSPKIFDSQTLNRTMRTPLLFFAILMIPLFYFLIERLFEKNTAIAATSLIGLSPILLGMSRIINPDALLWIFAPISLLSFLVYQKKHLFFYLYLAGISLGLSILTKYVANILFVFFFGMIFLEYIFNTSRYQKISFHKYLLASIGDYFMLVLFAVGTFYFLYPATWLSPERILKGTILSQAFATTWIFFALFIFLVTIEAIFAKSKISKMLVVFLASKKILLGKVVAALFLLSVLFVFLNVQTNMGFFNFEELLSSPKTAYKENGFLGMMLANFYPIVFGITPIAVFGLFAAFAKSFFRHHTIESLEKISATTFFALFIFVYYLGTTLNNVASTTRYQIMIFPILLVICGIGITFCFEKVFAKSRFKQNFYFFFIALIIGFSTLSLHLSKSSYLSYASMLLPEKYILDVKDMGPGSYEVAQYLNSLPDAEKLSIWTDKKGVCNFFVGFCYGDLSYEELDGVLLDYVAISWGRKSRTTNMVRSQTKLATHPILNFAKYYDQTENVAYELLINNRPGQYIKVFKVK